MISVNKTIAALLTLLFMHLGLQAQWYTTTNTSGTSLYGTTNVTVVGAGTASTYALWCGTGPYWIGAGAPSFPGPAMPGSYTYTFSRPQKAIKVLATAMNLGETIEIKINGAPYSLPAISPFAGPCGGGTAVALVGGHLECTADVSSWGSGGMVIVNYCGINSCEVATSGLGNGTVYTFMFTDSGNCFRAVNNSPCIGDTLFLKAIGDSVGATYSWSGPGGFTSTMQNPTGIYPCSFADSGLYTVIRVIGTVRDTSYTRVAIHPKPNFTVTSNAPLCTGSLSTLRLFLTPDSVGNTYLWSGPTSFTSTLVNPTRPGFSVPDTGWYSVVGITRWGCKDTAATWVGTVPPPPAPTINGVRSYCQGITFVPFTVTGYTGSLLWYTTPTGGTGSGIAPVVNTSVPGVTTVYVSQIIGGCESPRSSFTVRVTTTPPAPRVTGRLEYCQFIGPFEPHTIITTVSGVARWYTTPTGGSPLPVEPTPNINIAGSYDYYVSQIDSTCEGPRTHIHIVVHPKPAPPTVTHQVYCQYKPAVPLLATASTPGDFLLWFGDGIAPSGTSSTPTPNTAIPGVDTFYVNETSAFGCVSDKVMDTVRVLPKPVTPHTVDTTYCQFQTAVSLNNQTDSSNFSRLYWYLGGLQLGGTPTPSTTTPGKVTWYVGQTISGCRSDSVALSVTTLYVPKFDIVASSPWVCQFDSLTLSYKGPALVDPGYTWKLGKGDSLVHNSKITDSSIMVAFDSATKNNFIILRTSANGGRCFSSDTISINVIPQPKAHSYSKRDVCLGDTVSLALAFKTDNSLDYVWHIDYQYLLSNAPMLNVISHNSNSGGPFMISWLDTGRHVIQVNTTSKEGCKSEAAYDTINVHNIPDATFQYVLRPGALCLEDSVLFIANNTDYRNKYYWTPEHAFNNININESRAWARVENDRSIITLQITNPFGCEASKSLEINPGSCCTISMPNAFTPNGDGRNDFYQPLFNGYHRFHVFRITNRWGQTVFESSQNQMKWDGTLDGVPQDMGVYFYYIKYDCGGEKLEQSGDVTLIR